MAEPPAALEKHRTSIPAAFDSCLSPLECVRAAADATVGGSGVVSENGVTRAGVQRLLPGQPPVQGQAQIP